MERETRGNGRQQVLLFPYFAIAPSNIELMGYTSFVLTAMMWLELMRVCVCVLPYFKVPVSDVDLVFSARSLTQRFSKASSVLESAQGVLSLLLQRHGMTYDYFSTQWARQRELQLASMQDDSRRALELRLSRLIELEQALKDAQ